MSYDPRPELDPDAEQVTVYAADEGGRPGLMFVLVRPDAVDAGVAARAGSAPAGCVLVREWTASASDPAERWVAADAVYARVAAAQDARQRLTVDLRELRAWLDRATAR